MTLVAPRSPWKAVLLSLVSPGLGQLYNGEPFRCAIFLLLAQLVVASPILLQGTLTGMVMVVALSFGVVVPAMVDGWLGAKRAGWYEPRKYNRRTVYWLIFLLAAGLNFGVTAYKDKYFYKTFVIPTESMRETVVPGDRLVAESLSETRQIHRGDLVVFDFPQDPDKHFVKRVIGLPGDTLMIQSGEIFINNELLPEPYVMFTGNRTLPTRDFLGPVTMGPDQYFVMGDNRHHSNDSRYWGFVGRGAITHRMLYIYWPGSGANGREWNRLGKRM